MTKLEEDVERRTNALMNHPLSSNSMSQGLDTDHQTALPFDVWIESGWTGIVEECFAGLMALPERKRPRIMQIKEKFGQLRIYSEKGSRESLAIIARAEAKAERTCQFCGVRGASNVTGSRGWMVNACVTHAKLVKRKDRDRLPKADWLRPGEPVPILPVFLDMSENEIGLDGGTWSFEGQDSKVRVAAQVNAWLATDTPVFAVEPEVTAAALDRDLFGPAGEKRLFEVLPVRDRLIEIGLSAENLDGLLEKWVKTKKDNPRPIGMGSPVAEARWAVAQALRGPVSK